MTTQIEQAFDNTDAGYMAKSLEQRRKMSESASLSRSPLSEITKERISDAMVGNTNSKNHSSEEYRSKQSQIMKDAWARRKKKENA